MFNIQDAIMQAVETGPDMTQATAGGGGDYAPPAAGPTRLRLVGYIELGIQNDTYKGQPRLKEKVALIWELSGPKHPPREHEGKKYPILLTDTMTLSLSEKANFFKLFRRLNHTGEFRHFAQLLGKPFAGTVYHNEKGEGADKKVYANLWNDDGYSIRPPFFDTLDEAGNMVSMPLPVDEAISPLKCFIWTAQAGLKDMWDSLFIDGRYDDKKDEKTGAIIKEGRSKNYWQNTIQAATNFAGSPIAELLFAGGEPDLSSAAASTPKRSEDNAQASADAKAGAAADPLAGM